MTFSDSSQKSFSNYTTKVVEWVQDNQVVLEPFEGWWNQENRTDNVTRAEFVPIANDATRVAALLSGEIDLMYPAPLQDIDRLNADENVEVLQGPELRTRPLDDL